MIVKRIAEIVMGLSVPGIDSKCFAIFTHRFVHVALLEKREAQRVMRFSVFRIEANRFAKFSQCFFHAVVQLK